MKNTLSLAITFFLVINNTYAQVADTTIQLTPLDIIAPYKAIEQSPFTFQNLSQEDLVMISYGQEASFILQNTPSMTAYSDGGSHQGYSYFRMRGMDQTRVNITMDGVPLNEPEDQGVYFSNYPDFLNSIDQVQIQRGVGNSKNGNSSYAGSIQLSSPNLHDPQKAEMGLGYGSFNTYRGYAEYNSGIKNNKGLYLRASHLHSDGYRYQLANSSQSLFYSAGLFKQKHQLKLVGFIGNQQNELAWIGVSKPQIDQDPRTNVNSNEDDQFAQGLIQLQHAYTISDKSEWQTSIYYNHLQGNYDFDLNNFLGDPSSGPMLNYAFSSHFFGGFSNYTIEAKQLTFTTGLHANHYSRRHEGSSSDDGPLYENTGFRNDLSGIIKLNYTLRNVSLYGDLQVRYTSFDYEGSTNFERMDWTFVNPKAGINLALGTQSNLYYSVSRAC